MDFSRLWNSLSRISILSFISSVLFWEPRAFLAFYSPFVFLWLIGNVHYPTMYVYFKTDDNSYKYFSRTEGGNKWQVSFSVKRFWATPQTLVCQKASFYGGFIYLVTYLFLLVCVHGEGMFAMAGVDSFVELALSSHLFTDSGDQTQVVRFAFLASKSLYPPNPLPIF